MFSRRQFLAAMASLPLGGSALDVLAQPDSGPGGRVRGINYIPSYAASPYETWSLYDGEVIRRELGWAADLGLNAVRITLSYDACREKPTAFEDHMRDFSGVAESLNLRLMPVLFDSWGVSPSAYIGPGSETLREAYHRMQAQPASYRIDEARLRRFEVTATRLLPDRQVPRSGDTGVLLWGKWTPCPPSDRISQEYWSIYRHYVYRAVGAWGDSPHILAWDIMNNPSLGSALQPRKNIEESNRFVRLAIDEVRSAGATQPLTVSFAEGYGSIGPVIQDLDALSVQSMSSSPRDVQRAILETKSLSKGRPVYLTLSGAVLLPEREEETQEGPQARYVRQAIDASERAGAGWFLWHLVEGEAMTPWAGLVRRDGSLKPAAEYVQQEIRRLA